MAKVKATWTVEKSNLTCTFSDNTTASYDLAKIFPDFLKLDEIQQLTVGYGIKQKLSDKTAASKDAKLTNAERKAAMDETWKQLTVDKKWTSGKGGFGIRITVAKVDKATEAIQAIMKKYKVKEAVAKEILGELEAIKVKIEANTSK